MAKRNSKAPARGFTEPYLDNLKPKTQRYEVADRTAPGLRLRVSPKGTKTFIWYYQGVDGKRHGLNLGRYPGNSIAQAHKALKLAKAQHAEKEDPAALAADAPKTVNELAEIFYTRRILPHRKRPDIVRGVMDRDILPIIGKRKVATVTAPTIARVA